LRWSGFRRVRRQVCKRVQRRMGELGLDGPDAYRALLERSPGEWSALDGLCRIPISRFFRDRRVFERLEHEVLPELARAHVALHALCAGCASGEEPYSLKLLWELRVRPRFPSATLHITASDADERLLERARRGCYPQSSLRELPDDLREAAFDRSEDGFRLRAELREGIELRCDDLRRVLPPGPYALVLCRNLAFTYFEPGLQLEVLARIREHLLPGGYLVVGAHESLPAGARGFAQSALGREIHRAT
jgi:chemotaxis protein methyltransferase CheR